VSDDIPVNYRARRYPALIQSNETSKKAAAVDREGTVRKSDTIRLNSVNDNP
jgi:hypothetical protein